MRVLNRLIVFTPLIFFVTCTFQSDEEFFNDIPEPDPAAVNIQIQSINLAEQTPGDTIRIFGSTNFMYAISGKHGSNESMKVFLDGDLIVDDTQYAANFGNFSVSKGNLKSGIADLKLELVMASGSGSLADSLGAEKFRITQQWVLKVDLSVPPIPVVTAAIENGMLTLHWPEYTKPNFQKYRIKRLAANQTETIDIDEQSIHTWADMKYVGGYFYPFSYTVTVINEHGQATSVPVEQFHPGNVRFSFNILDSTVTVRWKPTEFYGTFQDYEFKPTTNLLGPSNFITSINDSIFTYKFNTIHFGGGANVMFRTRSKSPALPHDWRRAEVELGTPLPIPDGGNIQYSQYLNALVQLDAGNKLWELNNEFEPVREIAQLPFSTFQFPYPGRYVYYLSSGEITRLDLADNSLKLLPSGFNATVMVYTGAGNGLLAFYYTNIRYPNQPGARPIAEYRARVFDPVLNQYVYEENSPTVKVNVTISDDGRFLWANGNRVFKVDGATSVQVGTFSGSQTFMGFRPDRCEEMMFRNGNTIEFYDANTLSFIRSVSLQTNMEEYNRGYDLQTKKMVWDPIRGGPYTLDIETGAIEPLPPVVEYDYLINQTFILEGKYIKLPQ
jgi:hypothetical protein